MRHTHIAFRLGMGCPWLTPKPLGSSGVRGEGVSVCGGGGIVITSTCQNFYSEEMPKANLIYALLPLLLLFLFSLSLSLPLLLSRSIAVGVTISSRSNGHLRANYWIWSAAGATQKLNPIISLRPLATPLGATRADTHVCRCACIRMCVCVWVATTQTTTHTHNNNNNNGNQRSL